ncbi:hypothetical protein QER51_001174 [Salmonella enterica subsp. enterica serovar Muenster]|nr:hypothetical protein [Salmonella enterica subsp. enterica serovar Muenster]EKT5003074.1 hypothetical protein [Salmonella enterica subsp. enterica serovar Muenster]EKT5243063.1 hypothetical protein [Salmonella enterica subsp. enterica serovar Muenster]EKT5429702.1 hypothetical protein [Salmonella enterica subsp. enterica serovar Muenster]EKT5434227.1 hypothetical protein [Salmonella enterica subsp. enterica serovar Muenster]
MATDYIILLKKEVMEARAFISQALQILNDLSEIMMTMTSCLKLRISLSVTLGYVQIRWGKYV